MFHLSHRSGKDHLHCNLRVRFSINQNNTSILCNTLWKEIVAKMGKKPSLITALPAWPHPDKWREGECCSNYNSTSILQRVKISVVRQRFTLAAAACKDMKLQLQINLAGIIPQNDSCSDENNICTNSLWPGPGQSVPLHCQKAWKMHSPAGASDASAGHFEAVW